MSQLFRPSANAIAKISLVVGLTLVAFLGWALYRLYHSEYVNGVNVVVGQPVMFSHRHHVSGLGIDCRYCHTSVESSSFAGIPPTETCMTCHSQVWTDAPILEPVRESYRTGEPLSWVRVHDLPDFVYFNHAIHVKKGIGCTTCHGQIDQMPLVRQVNTLYMGWCLECHRHPEEYIRPREDIFNVNWSPPSDQAGAGEELINTYNVYTNTDCSTCHR